MTVARESSASSPPDTVPELHATMPNPRYRARGAPGSRRSQVDEPQSTGHGVTLSPVSRSLPSVEINLSNSQLRCLCLSRLRKSGLIALVTGGSGRRQARRRFPRHSRACTHHTLAAVLRWCGSGISMEFERVLDCGVQESESEA